MKRFIFLTLFLMWSLLGIYQNALASAAIQDGSVTPQKLDARTSQVDWALNCGLTATVSSNNLTVSLATSTGATPSTLSPCKVFFRNVTATTGQYGGVSRSSSLSITVPSTSTLGQTSAVNQYVWVYALNDAGTMDICVSGVSVFFDYNVNSATQIAGSGSGSSSGSTLYCASSHSGSKAHRLIGRLLVNETVAGTWASAPSQIDLFPIPSINQTDWVSAGATSVTSSGSSPTKPTAGNIAEDRIEWRRLGDSMQVRMSYRQTASAGGADGTGTYLWLLPNSAAINTSLITTNADANTDGKVPLSGVGTLQGSGQYADAANRGMLIPFAYDSTHFSMFNTLTGNMIQNGSSGGFGTISTMGYSINVQFPVSGWSTYGP